MKQKTTTLTKSDMSSDINSLHASYHKKNRGFCSFLDLPGTTGVVGAKEGGPFKMNAKKKEGKEGKCNKWGEIAIDILCRS